MTTCSLQTCEIMSKETNIHTLLCYYNALIQKLNTTDDEEDHECLADLASQINASLQNNLHELSIPDSRPIKTTDINTELNELLSTKEEDDAVVIKNMYQSNAMIWIILFFILLTLYILI